jgi:hypothetical protein
MNTLLRSFTQVILGCMWVLIVTSISYAQYERPTSPRIRGLDWSPDATTIAAAIQTPACWGYGAQLLNANTLVVERTLFDPYSCGGLTVDFNISGTELVIAEGLSVNQWDLSNYTIVGGRQGSVGYESANWQKHGIKFVVASLNSVTTTSILAQVNSTPI